MALDIANLNITALYLHLVISLNESWANSKKNERFMPYLHRVARLSTRFRSHLINVCQNACVVFGHQVTFIRGGLRKLHWVRFYHNSFLNLWYIPGCCVLAYNILMHKLRVMYIRLLSRNKYVTTRADSFQKLLLEGLVSDLQDIVLIDGGKRGRFGVAKGLFEELEVYDLKSNCF